MLFESQPNPGEIQSLDTIIAASLTFLGLMDYVLAALLVRSFHFLKSIY